MNVTLLAIFVERKNRKTFVDIFEEDERELFWKRVDREKELGSYVYTWEIELAPDSMDTIAALRALAKTSEGRQIHQLLGKIFAEGVKKGMGS